MMNLKIENFQSSGQKATTTLKIKNKFLTDFVQLLLKFYMLTKLQTILV